jgi:hypothetical protein
MPVIRVFLFIATAMLMAVACDKNVERSQSKVHPTADYYKYLQRVKEFELNETQSSFIRTYQKRFSEMDKVYELDDFLLTSFVWKILIADKDIYILDINQLMMFRVTSDNQIDTLAMKGKGPGEISSPKTFALEGDQLYITDYVNGLFSINLNNGEYNRISDGLNIEDFEVVDNNVVIKRFISSADAFYSSFKNIIIIDSNGLEANKFGNTYLDDHVWALSFYQQGQIAVSQSKRLLLEYDKFLPVIEKFTIDGKLIWSRRVPNFMIVNIKSQPGQWRVDEPYLGEKANLFNTIRSMHILSDSVAIMQIDKVSWTEGSIYESGKIKTYLMNLNTAEITELQNLYRIRAIDDHSVVLELKKNKFVLYSY